MRDGPEEMTRGVAQMRWQLRHRDFDSTLIRVVRMKQTSANPRLDEKGAGLPVDRRRIGSNLSVLRPGALRDGHGRWDIASQ